MPRPLVYYVVGSWISQWRGDIEIWENKIYRSKPVLSRADGPGRTLLARPLGGGNG